MAKCNKCGEEYIPDPIAPKSTCNSCQNLGIGNPFCAESGQITDKMNKDYVDGGGNRCPFCRHLGVRILGIPEIRPRGIRFPVICGRCRKAWFEFCQMREIEPIPKGHYLYRMIQPLK